ncbi:MAG: hypothetical protein H6978_07230 [Gammaproteobacteria bacterium]|nr:hypothetical protein [Gammaproteobacteria bacterium]
MKKNNNHPRAAMRHGYCGALALACLLAGSVAGVEAATVVTDGAGKVTGVNGLEANGSLYDLSFTGFGASYATTFPAGLQITDENEAWFIVTSLHNLFNGPAYASGFYTGQPADVTSEDLAGDGFTPAVALNLPYQEFGTPPDTVGYRTLAWSPYPVGTHWVIGGGTQSFSERDFSWGWIQVTPVPLPAPALLLSGGLGVLLRYRRRLAQPKS